MARRSTEIVVPKPGSHVTLHEIETLEMRIAAELPSKTDVAELRDWLNQASALASYLHNRDLQAPLMGAQRRIEARIGELLPRGRKGSPLPDELKAIVPHGADRHAFRVLSQAQTLGLTEEQWRQPRQVLMLQVRQQAGEPPPRARDDLRLVNACEQVARSASAALALAGVGVNAPMPVLSEALHERARVSIDAALIRLQELIEVLSG